MYCYTPSRHHVHVCQCQETVFQSQVCLLRDSEENNLNESTDNRKRNQTQQYVMQQIYFTCIVKLIGKHTPIIIVFLPFI